MKARVPIPNKQKKIVIDEVERLVNQQIAKETVNITRRQYKIMFAVLNEHFGFGTQRCLKLLDEMTKLIKQSDTDEVFWEHIDRLVINDMQIQFDRDYTVGGKACTEEQFKKKFKEKGGRV